MMHETGDRGTSRRFAVLSTYDAALLGYLLENLRRHQVLPAALILDSHQASAKDERIYAERTGGQLPWRPMHEHGFGLPVYFVESHKDGATLSLIQSLKLDFVINGGTPRILNAPILSSTELGVINCHPGRLPGYRGCTCPEWAILNDDPVCNTVHRMTTGIDEGPILATEAVTFPRVCSYQEMRVAVYRQGLDLLAKAARGLQDRTLGALSFVEQGPGRYHKPIADDGLLEVVRKLQLGLYGVARS